MKTVNSCVVFLGRKKGKGLKLMGKWAPKMLQVRCHLKDGCRRPAVPPVPRGQAVLLQ